MVAKFPAGHLGPRYGSPTSRDALLEQSQSAMSKSSTMDFLQVGEGVGHNLARLRITEVSMKPIFLIIQTAIVALFVGQASAAKGIRAYSETERMVWRESLGRTFAGDYLIPGAFEKRRLGPGTIVEVLADGSARFVTDSQAVVPSAEYLLSKDEVQVLLPQVSCSYMKRKAISKDVVYEGQIITGIGSGVVQEIFGNCKKGTVLMRLDRAPEWNRAVEAITLGETQ